MAFQSTRPRGARPPLRTYSGVSLKFQSTRPRGARQHERPQPARQSDVSIHAPAGGATGDASGAAPSTSGFNPRARGGRDMRAVVIADGPNTFQSTRPRGARPKQLDGARDASGFQSTRPRGARPLFTADDIGDLYVSIHAPAGGATGIGARHAHGHDGFNPRARGGRDPQSGNDWSIASGFNPRARGGRDVIARWHATPQASFNPRARGGRDPPPPRRQPDQKSFQSTRPRGARRRGNIRLATQAQVSIHAPAGGATMRPSPAPPSG